MVLLNSGTLPITHGARDVWFSGVAKISCEGGTNRGAETQMQKGVDLVKMGGAYPLPGRLRDYR